MTLNLNQLLAMWFGIGAGVLTLLYPVCDTNSRNVADTDFSAVHQYLYSWPLAPLDFGRTVLQLGIVTLLTVGVLISLKPMPKTKPQPDQTDVTVPVPPAAASYPKKLELG